MLLPRLLWCRTHRLRARICGGTVVVRHTCLSGVRAPENEANVWYRRDSRSVFAIAGDTDVPSRYATLHSNVKAVAVAVVLLVLREAPTHHILPTSAARPSCMHYVMMIHSCGSSTGPWRPVPLGRPWIKAQCADYCTVQKLQDHDEVTNGRFPTWILEPMSTW
jgi:hypothetical protein